MNETDPTIIRLSLEERRSERMVGLVTPSTKADWEIVRITHNLSAGDLITLSVKLLKQHPKLFDKGYELREKE